MDGYESWTGVVVMFLYVADDACGTSFTGADGRLREFDADDIDLLENAFGELGLRRSHALELLREWLSLAYETASNNEEAHASWMAGARRWEFYRARSGFHAELVDRAPLWLATFLGWVF